MLGRAAIVVVVTAGTIASAHADVITGEVVAAGAAWEGDVIVTTATVRTPTGDVKVRQLGGSADGYGMIVFDGALALEPGLRVRIDGRRDGSAWIADDVRSIEARGTDPYVRTVTKKAGTPLHWASGCVQIGYGVEGTSALPGDEERAVVEAALANWNTGGAACSYQHFESLGPITRETSGRDFVTVIKFRDVTWCRPAADGKAGYCHSPSAAGLTTVVFVDDPDNSRDGEIVDADVELNAVGFAIANHGVSLSDSGCLADLTNTLTHELGHVLGLEHTCRTRTDPPRVDDTGGPVPLCDETGAPAITSATMYPFQNCGETKKSTLAPDDLQALCDVYPIASDPGVCRPPAALESGCCSTGGAGAPSLALGLATLALLRLRRRPRNQK